jgi:soluble lytic murein transglycosylase
MPARSVRRELALAPSTHLLKKRVSASAVLAAAGVFTLTQIASGAPADGDRAQTTKPPAHVAVAQSTAAKDKDKKPAVKPKPTALAKPAAKSEKTEKNATKSAAKPEKKSTTKSSTKHVPEKAAAHRPAPATVKPVPAVAVAAPPAPVKNDDAAAPSQSAQPTAEIPQPANTIITAAAIDVAAVKRALELVRNHKQSQADDVKKSISDPVARKLVEWVILRSDDSGADFSRYVEFISANPNWPSIVTLRRKAEATAFQDRPNDAAVQSYFAKYPPLSAKGRLALARALLGRGDRPDAEALVRESWRYDGFSQDVESKISDIFGDFLTRADHKARMDRRLYEKDDLDAGLRAANRLGGNEPAIAKARIAMMHKGGDKAALEAVPAAAREDIGYKFARLQMLRRAEQTSEAVALLKTVPALDRSHDTDEWWIERRLLARKLLEEGKTKEAYQVVRDATPPARDTYRSEQQFMAGWIALRFLHDPATAHAHFRKIAEGNDNPIAIARGAYWTGRAAEALNRPQEARQAYQEAARYPTAYYGQIARARAGLGELHLNPFPTLTSAERSKATSSDIVRAAELLYAVEARDLAWTMMADLGDKSTDTALLVLLSELAAKYRDARGMMLVGKLALARGYALDHAAFPTIGIPGYKPIGPPVEPAIVYSIARQESWFNPKTISSANALGLMQVTPEAGRYVAKKFGATFDQKRLLSDNAYNVQMGSAELGDVIKDYRGSYILAFAAYNAGRGRVRDWVSRFGDPRDPKVDPIDWVERIPFSETRNYVQRVMENVQVYRLRFGGSNRLLIEADLRRGAATN